MYTVDYFIEKFEKIPEKLWCVKTRSNGHQRCAIGWCYPTHEEALQSENYRHVDSEEDRALVSLIKTIDPLFGVGGINNGLYNEYPQPTPKQRILAALYDIKKMQQPAYKDITKDLAVLPEDKIEVDVKTIVNV